MVQWCEYKKGLVDWPTDKSEKTHYEWTWGYNNVATKMNVVVHE